MVAPVDAVSKGEFARLRGVTPGRVSQWIAEGKITADALVGEGRSAMIRVGVATDQLRDRLDVGQMLGNGLATNLDDGDGDDDGELPFASPAPRASTRNPLDESIRRARLEQLQRSNRQAERDELAERGLYTLTTDARTAMVGVAAAMLATFEGALADLATAISAQHQIPHRDLLHILRTEFRTIRAKAAEAARRRAEGLDEIIAHDQGALDGDQAEQ